MRNRINNIENICFLYIIRKRKQNKKNKKKKNMNERQMLSFVEIKKMSLVKMS